MNRKAIPLILSWVFWSIGYYLFYPFLSIFLSKIFNESEIPKFYLISQFFGISLPIIGGILGEKIGYKNTIIISMSLSGMGLILLSFSYDFTSALLFQFVYYLYALSLPNYYLYLSSMGKGYISLTWGYSILPSLICPYLGGLIAENFGIRTIFIFAGIFFITSALPIFHIHNITVNKIVYNNYIKINLKLKKLFIPLICIIPIAVVSPFIYLYVYNKYNLHYIEIGILSTLAEILGMVLVFLHYKLKKTKHLLITSLILFSLIVLTYYTPFTVIFFGLWESIIPLSLEYTIPKDSPKLISVINSLQSIAWLIGYLISYLVNTPDLLIILSSMLTLVIAIVINSIKNQ
ncbi:MAG: hypothetical protein QW250_00105 [Sulfolobaceae archaeon]